jgi:hypothetical protein
METDVIINAYACSISLVASGWIRILNFLITKHGSWLMKHSKISYNFIDVTVACIKIHAAGTPFSAQGQYL